ncbi:hypothetical protein [Methanosalsum natronophilum]|uniref:hypothetical protein n=1 Tax=Methanosalsum natronophilum TaxID=768733 RepID=UPI0021696186|nr:hypothetical protein [Methanosalsum natronophilum]MCS3924681.1 sRNA-binding regulator protein Hfq [Methanosalsum natronophilum]
MKNIDLFSDYTLLKKERKKGQLLYRWSRFELLNLENDLIKPSEHIFNKNICCSCKSTHAENGKKVQRVVVWFHVQTVLVEYDSSHH